MDGPGDLHDSPDVGDTDEWSGGEEDAWPEDSPINPEFVASFASSSTLLQSGLAAATPMTEPRKVSLFYPSLPLSSDPEIMEVRLLRILPGQHDQPIECILRIVSLGACEDYEALSYTWGRATRKRSVKVNGSWMSVTDNLWLALRRLRREGEHRTIWIDALCVNQQDLAERSQQVAVMDKIYSSALSTLVWLGDAKPLMRDQQSPFLPTIMTTINDSTLCLVEDHKMRSLFDAITSTLPSWWTRVWVVQEFVLSSNDPTVCFGCYTVSWKELRGLLEAIQKAPYKYKHGTDELRRKLPDLEEIRTSARASSVTLDKIFFLTAAMAASDPRDHIYSLMNLLPHSAADQITVDYSLTSATVFTNTTYYLIKSMGHFGILHLRMPAEHSEQDSALNAPLPSWAVNFSTNLDGWPFGSQPWPELRLFAWSDSKIASLRQHFNSTTTAGRELRGNALVCLGLVLDTVRMPYGWGTPEEVNYIYEKQVSHIITEVAFALLSGFRQDDKEYHFGDIARARILSDSIFQSLADEWNDYEYGKSLRNQETGWDYVKRVSNKVRTKALSIAAKEIGHSNTVAEKESIQHSNKVLSRVFARLDLISDRRRAWHVDYRRPGDDQWKAHLEEFSELCNLRLDNSSSGDPRLGVRLSLRRIGIPNSAHLSSNLTLSMKATNSDLSFRNVWSVDDTISAATGAWLKYLRYCDTDGSMYCTLAGFVGVGVGRVEAGDVVALLDTEPCPMILRPTSDGYIFRGFTYIPIGEHVANSEFKRKEFRLI